MRYEILFTVIDDNKEFSEYSKIIGDDLVKLVSQIPLMIAHAARQEKEKEIERLEREISKLRNDDEIPF